MGSLNPKPETLGFEALLKGFEHVVGTTVRVQGSGFPPFEQRHCVRAAQAHCVEVAACTRGQRRRGGASATSNRPQRLD